MAWTHIRGAVRKKNQTYKSGPLRSEEQIWEADCRVCLRGYGFSCTPTGGSSYGAMAWGRSKLELNFLLKPDLPEFLIWVNGASMHSISLRFLVSCIPYVPSKCLSNPPLVFYTHCHCCSLGGSYFSFNRILIDLHASYLALLQTIRSVIPAQQCNHVPAWNSFCARIKSNSTCVAFTTCVQEDTYASVQV